MKNRKQRYTALEIRRADLIRYRSGLPSPVAGFPPGALKVNPSCLAPDGSRDVPEFVRRGYYIDLPFVCVDCGVAEVWRASQQRWWFEIAKGGLWTVAKRCRACRRTERTRSSEARRIHLSGVRAKRPRGSA